MLPNRRARLKSVIHQELAKMIPKDVRDPRVKDLTVTGVELSEDGRNAVILVSIFGDGVIAREANTPIEDGLEGLKSASGFLRRHLAKALNVRYVPFLIFKEDKGLRNSLRVHELLKEINKEQPLGA